MANINYKGGNYNFPQERIDPRLKAKPTYCRQFAEAAYSKHLNNFSGVRNLKGRDIPMLKL